MSNKKKYPRALAMEVAAELCRELKPACVRMVVAGSLRRRKEQVGDVEILFIPMFEEVPDGLFDVRLENRADQVLQALIGRGVIKARENVNGSTAWGAKNKLAMHVRTGVPVDLFTATAENWFNYLVCRTGGAQSNLNIAMAAQGKGWKWNPYGAGFTNHVGELERVESEADVFRLAGLPYKEPWER